MGRAGRPQGRLKGETEQADALARFVQEVTSGVTVRELAQRYQAGKTSWSEYRSAEKDIPWHLLQKLIISYNSALCLSVRDSSTEAAAQVIQSACKDNPGQSWKIEKWPRGIRFVNGNSQQCLAVSYGSTAPQAPLMQYPCGDYPDHYWDYGPRR